ncbi:hypothetical protein ACTXIU_14235 [Glutamicibacter arilaitensis]|uniref:hypothetical protein n=1 Tax=Glutamicibacter arilaitensis TaxID=256701 RepID=UPI003FD12AD7
MSNRAKAIIAIFVIAGIITAAYIFSKPDQAQRTTTSLTINSSPLELDLTLAGKDYGTVRNGESITLESAEPAEIEASRDGFETFNTTVQVTEGQPNTIDIALRPISQEAKDLVLSEDDLLEEEQAAEDYLNTAEEAYKKWPILRQMPHEDRTFAIYQGLPESVGYDFGIYLILYKGHEEQGRKAFDAWMEDKGFNLGDYDIIETIKPAKPSNDLPEQPSSEKLEDLSVDEIKIPSKISKTDGNADQIAQLFATSTTTWNPVEDSHPTAALLRAKPLMTKTMADGTEMPFRITTTPTWRAAEANESKSYSWIHAYESEKAKDTTKATIEVCWAWISSDSKPTIDGPRKYELEINKNNEISSYTYTDPDPFIDNTNTNCNPEN